MTADPTTNGTTAPAAGTAWRMRPAVRLRRSAEAVRTNGAFRLGDGEASVAAVADWLGWAADVHGAWERDGRTAPDTPAVAALAFAEALPLVITHDAVITSRQLRGARRNGTHLACTYGDSFGIVGNEPPSRGGRATALARHQVHVRHAEGAPSAGDGR